MGESYSYKSDEKRKGKRKKTWGWGVKSIVLILGIVAVVSLATYLPVSYTHLTLPTKA